MIALSYAACVSAIHVYEAYMTSDPVYIIFLTRRPQYLGTLLCDQLFAYFAVVLVTTASPRMLATSPTGNFRTAVLVWPAEHSNVWRNLDSQAWPRSVTSIRVPPDGTRWNKPNHKQRSLAADYAQSLVNLGAEWAAVKVAPSTGLAKATKLGS
jgi:hypothetical protein